MLQWNSCRVRIGRACPTNNALLINFRLGSDAEIFVYNHRLSMQTGAKHAKTCMERVRIPTELQFCVPSVMVGCTVLVPYLLMSKMIGKEGFSPFHHNNLWPDSHAISERRLLVYVQLVHTQKNFGKIGLVELKRQYFKRRKIPLHFSSCNLRSK